MMITDSEDLLIEILLWLPPKSLIRFKLVCKRWLILISSHHFSDQHTLQQRHQRCRSKRKPSLLVRLAEASGYLYLHSSVNGEKLVPYLFSSTLVEPTIRSSSNGLFLLQCGNVENPFEVCHVYNPATKQSRKILLNVNETYTCLMGLNVVFDPLKSPDYKIVCVKAAPMKSVSYFGNWWRRCQIEVYESNTRTWKLCDYTFLSPRLFIFDHGVVWKGRVNWCGMFYDLQECVVGVHPELVVPGEPGYARPETFYSNFVESNGYLHTITHFAEKKSFMIFELHSDYSNWSLKYHIHLDAASGPHSVLSMVKGESDEDSMLVFHEPGKIKFYALPENCVKLSYFREQPYFQEGCAQSASLQGNCVKELVYFGGKEFNQEGCAQSASNRAFQVMETLARV